MRIKIKIKRQLDEMSSAGAVSGYAGPFGSPEDVDTFNKNGAKEQRLKGRKMVEMMSTSTGKDVVRHFSVEDEEAAWRGTQERGAAQGNRAIREQDDSFEDTFSNEPDTADALASASSKPTDANSIIDDQLAKRGIKKDDKKGAIGQGQFGTVYLGEYLNSGLECAIKIVGLGKRKSSEEAVRREVGNYSKVSAAREGSDAIWAHFPEVYDSWIYDDEDGLGYMFGFVIMEKLLPASEEQKTFVPDIFSIVARRHPMDIEDLALHYGAKKDLRKRAAFWARDLEHVTMVFEMYDDLMRRNEPIDPSDEEEYQQILASVSRSALKRYERMADNNPDKIKKLIKDRMRKLGYWAFDFEWLDGRDALDNDLGADSYIKLIWADLIYAIARIGYFTNTPEKEINQMVKEMSAEVINGYRKSTGFPVSFGSGGELSQDDADRARKMAPARDLYLAMQELYKKTGLLAKDVHDDNVMTRDGSNDLVIVDLGLFKQLSKPKQAVKESRTYRIKLLTNPKK